MAEFISGISGQFGNLSITSGVQLTGKVLGTGSDATVLEVDWNGTICAAKKLHEILLRDQSPGGAEHFIANFMKECQTWSTLRHPQIIQILGVYSKKKKGVPMLILEKMDTSLRHYLEKHTKENFVLPDKIYILRQVAQALSYLHSRSPPLVHHDLSPNNVLLNEVSLQAKVTDFGMTRAMDPSKMTRKSSAKGTQAFMPPEALHSPPRYDEKLDVFSYGNVIVTTVIHDWPEPGPPTTLERGKIIGFSELQRRQQHLVLFTPKENELFLPIVGPCLQNDSRMRPTSIQLVTQMRGIEESHPRRRRASTATQKNNCEECEQLQHHLHELEEELDRLKGQVVPVQKKSQRNWKNVKYQNALKCGVRCASVATKRSKSKALAVGTSRGVEMYRKDSHKLLYTIGEGQLGGDLFGLAFYDEKNILVSDYDNGKIKMFTIQGQHVRTIDRGSTTFKPWGITISPDGHIYVCDGANHCVCVFDVNGKFLFSFGSHGSGNECFDEPMDLCFASDGFLYITDGNNNRVCVFDKTRKFIRKFTTTYKPDCIDATDSGHLIVSSGWSHKVMIYTTGGDLVHVFGKSGSELGQFRSPTGVLVADGLIYIADYGNSRIQVFRPLETA